MRVVASFLVELPLALDAKGGRIPEPACPCASAAGADGLRTRDFETVLNVAERFQ
jgi:hypothetical protein